MYLLDTNVISDLRKSRRFGKTTSAWFASVSPGALYISAVSIFELQHGIANLARRDAARADDLDEWLSNTVLTGFERRILALDFRVARRAGGLHAGRIKIDADRLIAATALVHDFAVVTRNVGDFRALGVRIVNPFA